MRKSSAGNLMNTSGKRSTSMLYTHSTKNKSTTNGAKKLQQSSIIIMCFATLTLAACSISEDFGRSHTPKLIGHAGDIVGSIQEHTGVLSRQAAFHIPLTHQEHTLRQTLTHFRKPFLHTPTLRKPLKTQTFPKHQTVEGFKAYFLNQIKSDRLWVRRFKQALSKVISHDIQRYEVLSSSHEVTENDSRYIKVRIRENRSITMRVMQLLDRRLSDYSKAMDYSRLSYPEKHLAVFRAPMDKYRAEVGLLKAKYESYVYQQAAKADFRDYE